MLMQYTGRDGDLGLKNGELYHVEATNYHPRWNLCVFIYDRKTYPEHPIFCPYDTFDGFLMNWKTNPLIKEEIEEEDDWSDF